MKSGTARHARRPYRLRLRPPRVRRVVLLLWSSGVVAIGFAMAYYFVPGPGPSLIVVALACAGLPLLISRVRLRAQEVLRVDDDGVRLLRVTIGWEEIAQIVISGPHDLEIDIGVMRHPGMPGRTLITERFTGDLDLDGLVNAVRTYGPDGVEVVRVAEGGRHVVVA